jgi:hypothetical protein
VDNPTQPPKGGQFGLLESFLQGFADPLKCPESPACGLPANAAAGTESANAPASSTAVVFLRISFSLSQMHLVPLPVKTCTKRRGAGVGAELPAQKTAD